MENREAYNKCVELCAQQGWYATHTALTEDGYSDDCDFVKLYEDWSKNAKT